MLFKDLLGKKLYFLTAPWVPCFRLPGLSRANCRNCGTSAMPLKLKNSHRIFKRRCGYYKNKYFWRKPP